MSDLDINPSNLVEYIHSLQRKPFFRMLHCLNSFWVQGVILIFNQFLNFHFGYYLLSIHNHRMTSPCLAGCSQITSFSLISQDGFREYLHFNIKVGKNRNRKINLQQDQKQNSQLNINLEGIIQLFVWSLITDDPGLIAFCFFLIQNKIVNKSQE